LRTARKRLARKRFARERVLTSCTGGTYDNYCCNMARIIRWMRMMIRRMCAMWSNWMINCLLWRAELRRSLR